MSQRCYDREVANGTMRQGGIGRPRTMECHGCRQQIWEDEIVQRGAYQVPYCINCDPLRRGDDYCEACGFDVPSCQCDRSEP